CNCRTSISKSPIQMQYITSIYWTDSHSRARLRIVTLPDGNPRRCKTPGSHSTGGTTQMNRTIAVMLFAIAAWMMAGSANAQSPVLKVNVPFNFTVNSTFLPAGNYEVGFDSMHPNVLVIQDRAKNVRARAYVQRGS